jgi:hypothetical protein
MKFRSFVTATSSTFLFVVRVGQPMTLLSTSSIWYEKSLRYSFLAGFYICCKNIIASSWCCFPVLCCLPTTTIIDVGVAYCTIFGNLSHKFNYTIDIDDNPCYSTHSILSYGGLVVIYTDIICLCCLVCAFIIFEFGIHNIWIALQTK